VRATACVEDRVGHGGKREAKRRRRVDVLLDLPNFQAEDPLDLLDDRRLFARLL
jgi:hypothetical protein